MKDFRQDVTVWVKQNIFVILPPNYYKGSTEREWDDDGEHSKQECDIVEKKKGGKILQLKELMKQKIN